MLAPSRTSLASESLPIKSDDDAAIKEALRLLRKSESLAVVEYIKTVVPVVYVIYITILFHLPNVKYYRDMEGFAEVKLRAVVANILIYAFMELLSLCSVHHILQRHFKISIFYQLAFSLEIEWPIYHAAFVGWMLIVFQLLLAASEGYVARAAGGVRL